MDFNILNYGAVGDGLTENRAAIQKAIDACAASGGGCVTVPAGTFRTGSLELKSNVELHLSQGACLKATDDHAEYNEDDAYPQNFGVKSEGWNAKHLIFCHDQKNVSITGPGVIDGNAAAFYGENRPNTFDDFVWRWGVRGPKDETWLRPGQLVVFAECENVRVTDVTLQNATAWTLFFYGCTFVTARGLHIFNEKDDLNTDGIDIDSCRCVTVSDCVILTGDDALTVRGSGGHLLDQDRACEYVTINNCVLRASACGVRVGVGFLPIRHVRFSELIMESAGDAICICPAWSPNTGTPVEDVSFSGITVEKAACAIKLWALSGTPVNDLRLSDVTANAETALILDYPAGENHCRMQLRDVTVRGIRHYTPDVPERPGDHPFVRIRNVDLWAENVRFFVGTSRFTDVEAEKTDGLTVVKG